MEGLQILDLEENGRQYETLTYCGIQLITVVKNMIETPGVDDIKLFFFVPDAAAK